MTDGVPGLVLKQVLLRDIGDVFGLGVLREQVIERLILARPDFRGDGFVPLLAVVELRIDVEDDASKGKSRWRTTWPIVNFAALVLAIMPPMWPNQNVISISLT